MHASLLVVLQFFDFDKRCLRYVKITDSIILLLRFSLLCFVISKRYYHIVPVASIKSVKHTIVQYKNNRCELSPEATL